MGTSTSKPHEGDRPAMKAVGASEKAVPMSAASGSLPDLPVDVWALILRRGSDSPKAALCLASVCKNWREIVLADSTGIWSGFARNEWKVTPEKSSTRNWYGYYRRRHIAVDKRARHSASPIVECDPLFEFKCPLIWEDLKPTPGDASTRHCDVCHKKVYLCSDEKEIASHAEQGHCVALMPILAHLLEFDPVELERPMGLIRCPSPPPSKALASRLFGSSDS